MKPIPSLLSKTKLMRGYRCPKCIYLTIHHPELEAAITPDLQALFDQGNQVGEKAREYYPNGILIDNPNWDFYGAITKTQTLIKENTPIIYEAAFSYAGCYARLDILKLDPKTKRFHVIEVKSSTKLKPEHLDDIGLQVWIMSKNNIPIESIQLLHLNPACRHPDLSNLFHSVDITDSIRERYQTTKPKVREIIHTINQPAIPDIDIGPYCQTPTPCGFIEHCWQENNIPAMSIFNLPKLRTRQWELYQQGIIELSDARLTELNELQQRIVSCHQTGERYLNYDGIVDAISQWTFPLVFLDFETINPAIPRYPGCRPFSQVPFQFSVHILESLDNPPTHIEFLHDTADDPRPTLIPALIQACQTSGSIIAYFGKFEAERIQELAAYSPQHGDDLLKLIDRIFDPLPVIRENVYDTAFMGSFSLKKVAPGLLGASQSYEGMIVGNGGEAQRAFERIISPTLSKIEKDQLRHAMLAYCKKDTEVMVELARWLFNIKTNKTP